MKLIDREHLLTQYYDLVEKFTYRSEIHKYFRYCDALETRSNWVGNIFHYWSDV